MADRRISEKIYNYLQYAQIANSHVQHMNGLYISIRLSLTHPFASEMSSFTITNYFVIIVIGILNLLRPCSRINNSGGLVTRWRRVTAVDVAHF